MTLHHRQINVLTYSLLLLVVLGVLAFPIVGMAHVEGEEAHKAILQRVYDEAFNQGDLAVLDEVYASGYVNSGLGEDMTLKEFKAMLASWQSAMPDFAAKVEILIAEEEWAASRVMLTGTFENEWIMGDMTISPNNKPIQLALHIIHRFDENDQIVEDFTAMDSLGLLIQLDASPLPIFLASALGNREHVEANTAPLDFEVTEAILEGNEAAFTAVIEAAINEGDLTAIDTNLVEDYVTHEPFGSFSKAAFRDVIAGFRAAVPDLHVTIDAVVTEGEWLAARLIYTGTFTNGVAGDGMTVDATNREIRFIINVFERFNEDSLAIEDFKEYNGLGWLQQIGLLPK